MYSLFTALQFIFLAKMLLEAGLMEERDYQTYTHLFANMSNFMVCVYLFARLL